jgi:D-beta-D-heptose 7-phosphate kinase/D-beta-D-heptose 1-phosphate adenosyltransferase
VSIFGEDTPLELIRALLPDVLVKGGDYRPDEVVGRDVVEANGGDLVLIPLVEGHSTTGLAERLAGRGLSVHAGEPGVPSPNSAQRIRSPETV